MAAPWGRNQRVEVDMELAWVRGQRSKSRVSLIWGREATAHRGSPGKAGCLHAQGANFKEMIYAGLIEKTLNQRTWVQVTSPAWHKQPRLLPRSHSQARPGHDIPMRTRHGDRPRLRIYTKFCLWTLFCFSLQIPENAFYSDCFVVRGMTWISGEENLNRQLILLKSFCVNHGTHSSTEWTSDCPFH